MNGGEAEENPQEKRFPRNQDQLLLTLVATLGAALLSGGGVWFALSGEVRELKGKMSNIPFDKIQDVLALKQIIDPKETIKTINKQIDDILPSKVDLQLDAKLPDRIDKRVDEKLNVLLGPRADAELKKQLPDALRGELQPVVAKLAANEFGTQINEWKSRITKVESKLSSVLADCRITESSDEREKATASCPASYQLLSGGCAITGGNGGAEDLVSSHPTQSNPPSWFCRASSDRRIVKAYAYCCQR